MIDRKKILREYMGLTKLTDKCDDDDDRLECGREHDNKRRMEAIFSFTEALYVNHLAVARRIANENDWSLDEISDLINWWFLEG